MDVGLCWVVGGFAHACVAEILRAINGSGGAFVATLVRARLLPRTDAGIRRVPLDVLGAHRLDLRCQFPAVLRLAGVGHALGHGQAQGQPRPIGIDLDERVTGEAQAFVKRRERRARRRPHGGEGCRDHAGRRRHAGNGCREQSRERALAKAARRAFGRLVEGRAEALNADLVMLVRGIYVDLAILTAWGGATKRGPIAGVGVRTLRIAGVVCAMNAIWPLGKIELIGLKLVGRQTRGAFGALPRRGVQTRALRAQIHILREVRVALLVDAEPGAWLGAFARRKFLVSDLLGRWRAERPRPLGINVRGGPGGGHCPWTHDGKLCAPAEWFLHGNRYE